MFVTTPSESSKTRVRCAYGDLKALIDPFCEDQSERIVMRNFIQFYPLKSVHCFVKLLTRLREEYGKSVVKGNLSERILKISLSHRSSYNGEFPEFTFIPSSQYPYPKRLYRMTKGFYEKNLKLILETLLPIKKYKDIEGNITTNLEDLIEEYSFDNCLLTNNWPPLFYPFSLQTSYDSHLPLYSRSVYIPCTPFCIFGLLDLTYNNCFFPFSLQSLQARIQSLNIPYCKRTNLDATYLIIPEISPIWWKGWKERGEEKGKGVKCKAISSQSTIFLTKIHSIPKTTSQKNIQQTQLQTLSTNEHSVTAFCFQKPYVTQATAIAQIMETL